jgi:hypothetical protein
MAISGETPPGPKTVNCEEYDGTSWSEIANVSTAGNPSGNSPGGSVSSAFLSSGQSRPLATEEYNKSTNTITAAAWASGNNMNTARKAMYGGSIGTQTAGLAVAGNPGSPGSVATNINEEYNGSSWTESGDLNTARAYLGGFGTQTAAVGCGGYIWGDGNKNLTEEYDGSSWTAGNAMNTARRALAACGTLTSGLIFGGYITTHSNATEEYDGTNWTSSPGNLNTANELGGGCGTQTAGLSFNGDGTGPNPTQTEEYDGSSWTTGNANIKQAEGVASAGIQTAALSMAGANPPPTKITTVTGYDGTTWSTRPSMSTARWEISGGGTSTAALGFGGDTGSVSNATEEFTGETSAANIENFTTS